MHARVATANDAAAIAAIYTQGIEDRVATFETEPRTATQVQTWFDGQHPIVVVEHGEEVIAYASSSSYRPRACYAGIAEFAVYVRRDWRGKGAGRLALSLLVQECEAAGFWKLVSRAFVENTASRALLKTMGFREVGVYEKHGQLDGIWHDVVIIEYLLQAGKSRPGNKEITHPRFAAFYNWMMAQTWTRQMFDPLRKKLVGQAEGIVLEVGAGGGQNFTFYDPAYVREVRAIEPDRAMLLRAEQCLAQASVPIHLMQAAVEELPFANAHFDSVVITLVLCSVRDQKRSLREIWRVLKPGGMLLLLEHVRAQGAIAAWMQDALVPLTKRCLGNCHWNRNTLHVLEETGFVLTHIRQLGGGLQPVISLRAMRPTGREEPDGDL